MDGASTFVVNSLDLQSDITLYYYLKPSSSHLQKAERITPTQVRARFIALEAIDNNLISLISN